MDALTFTIPGQPVAQPRPRISTRGGRGRAYTPKSHPIHAYRHAIALAAKGAANARRHQVTDGPVVLEVLAVFGRPKSHLAKNGSPRASAPLFPPKNDASNVAKGVEDAITDSEAVWGDDDQVVGLIVWKRYAFASEMPRTVITIRSQEHGET